MHFITGGAFNGKRAWVMRTYKIKAEDAWISAYDDSPFLTDIHEIDQDILVLEGMEIWLKGLTKEYNASKAREIWNSGIDSWLTWEKEKLTRKLVVIGTDISKGIVPLDRENRVWRDVTGWAYQDIVERSDKVDIIWYGLNQTIKERGNCNENLHSKR